jgi:Zn-dependent metalloprotease
LAHSARFRGQREILSTLTVGTPAGQKRRTVYTERNGTTLPGKLVRGEGDPKVKDISANEAYDSSGVVYDFFQKVFARNSTRAAA